MSRRVVAVLVVILCIGAGFFAYRRWNATTAPQGATQRSRPAEPSADPSGGAESRAQAGMVWVQSDASLRAIAVTIGISDGTSTEVSSEDLHEGDHVVTA